MSENMINKAKDGITNKAHKIVDKVHYNEAEDKDHLNKDKKDALNAFDSKTDSSEKSEDKELGYITNPLDENDPDFDDC